MGDLAVRCAISREDNQDREASTITVFGMRHGKGEAFASGQCSLKLDEHEVWTFDIAVRNNIFLTQSPLFHFFCSSADVRVLL